MFPKIPEVSLWFSGKKTYQKTYEDESHLLKNFPLSTSQLTQKKNYNDFSAGTFEPAGTQSIDFN